MWVRFSANFDFKPKSTVTIAYKAGDVVNVPRTHADAAIAHGAAEKTASPKGAPKGDDDDGLPNG